MYDHRANSGDLLPVLDLLHVVGGVLDRLDGLDFVEACVRAFGRRLELLVVQAVAHGSVCVRYDNDTI